MNKEAVLHIPLSQYAYAENEHTITVRIRTAKNDVKECIVYYGDRVDIQEPIRTTAVVMKKAASDDLFDYFEADIADRYTRVCYYFSLSDGKEKQFYYSRGFCKEINCHRTEYFQFPYIRREDIHKIPEWAEDIVMYHIFPDSFASGKRRLDKCPKKKSVHPKLPDQEETAKAAISVSNLGGTLRGVQENIDYLKELGINCIYLNPIFAANSYHKYDTIDYFDVDPCFGTKEDLKALVQSCHENGIRVLFDGVFNHCGPDFFAFRDVLEKGKESKYHSWFYQMPTPVEYRDPPNYEAFAYVKEMPKLNTGNPAVAEYLCRVGTYWIQEADIDGWRLDVANEIDHDFWRRFRKAVHAVKKDCFLIAEIWEDSNVWLSGDQFDSTMNYTFSYLCKDFFASRKIGVTEFDEQMHKMIMRYPRNVSLVQMNFLDSHDVPRFLSYCNGNKERMELAFFYLFMGVGIPSVFYGDECYISGTTEPEYRAPMDWEKADRKETACFSRWIKLRREYPALTHGDYGTVLRDDARGLYGFTRTYKEQTLLVLLNNSDDSQTIKLQELYLEGAALLDAETLEPFIGDVSLKPLSGKVYKVDFLLLFSS